MTVRNLQTMENINITVLNKCLLVSCAIATPKINHTTSYNLTSEATPLAIRPHPLVDSPHM